MGKIGDLFAGVGVTRSAPGRDQRAGAATSVERLLEELRRRPGVREPDRDRPGLRPSQGRARASRGAAGDRRCAWPGMLERLREGDLLIVTADHGVDPAHPGHRPHARVRAAAGAHRRDARSAARGGRLGRRPPRRSARGRGRDGPALADGTRGRGGPSGRGVHKLRLDARAARGRDDQAPARAAGGGPTAARVEILDPRWSRPLAPEELAAALEGRRVERLGRRGKYLLWSFEGDVHLAQHLRMTGAVLADPDPEPAHTRVRVDPRAAAGAAQGAGAWRSWTRAASARASCCSARRRWRSSSPRGSAWSRSTSSSPPSTCAG